jgi:hypothetical protein
MINMLKETRQGCILRDKVKEERGENMAQAQDKHCDGCGWTGHTSSDTCPKCGHELSDD